MPTIDTAEDAVNAAEIFLARYHANTILKRVVRQGEKWVMEFEVATSGTNIVRVTVDAQTGNVLEYGEVNEVGH
jgi:uncharacterized membrane protein YkoI